jgi:hypothetical protein
MAKPGPKPDPSKPNSRYNPASRHTPGGSSICGSGHEWVEGSYKLRGDGKKICLICIEERKGDTCKAGHSREEFQNKYGACRACQAEKMVARRLMEKYGLTPEALEDMIKAQDGRCAVCREEFDAEKHNGICVDHDHSCCPGEKTCGKCVRGILCDCCNKLLGNARDSVEILEAAVKYLLEN